MQGFTLWFTGLSGSGKTTLSRATEAALAARGYPVTVIDGDELRRQLGFQLGFSREARDANVRRAGEACNAIVRGGSIAIAALISPYREARARNRAELGRYVEVYCACPLAELIRRDPKGLYRRALAGEISNFTGIDDPYEEPTDAELVVHTNEETLEESTARVLALLEPWLGDAHDRGDAEAGGCPVERRD